LSKPTSINGQGIGGRHFSTGLESSPGCWPCPIQTWLRRCSVVFWTGAWWAYRQKSCSPIEKTLRIVIEFFFLVLQVFFFWFFNSFFNFIIFGIKLCGILCLSWLGDLRVLIKKIIAQLPLGLQKLNKGLLIESN
jgi:hypothetical protein